MFKNILVPLDGSHLAESILPHVAAIAHAYDSQVILFCVLDPHTVNADQWPPVGKLTTAAEDTARAYLTRARSYLKALDIEARAVIRRGIAADEITRYADRLALDLIAMSTHGRSGLRRWMVGSVTTQVIRSARIPVLAFRPPGAMARIPMLSAQEQPEPQVGFSRIVVPLDGSQLAEAALPWAADIAFRLDLKLTLVMSISTALATAGVAELAPIAPEEIVQALALEAKRYLAAVAGWGSGQGVRCEFEVLRGEAAATIADFANQVDRSLIAISTHGRSGLGRVLMGSVADALIRNSGNTVLVVRPQLREQPKAIESFPRPSEAQPVSTEHR